MTDLATLARLAGIQTSFADVWGNDHHVSEDTQRLLLIALGYNAINNAEMAACTAALKADQNPLFPSVRVLQAERYYELAAPAARAWAVTDEKGVVQEGDVARDIIALSPLRCGYYSLHITHSKGEAVSFLMVAPPKCWLPEKARQGKRVWGISAQVYSLVSHTNFGMGDFGDLTKLIKFAATQKADIIGVNPMHSLFPSNPGNYSPYAPSNRVFLNTLYIDVTSVSGFSTCEAAKAMWQDPNFQEKLTKARDAEFIDYTLVAELKDAILRPLYEHFKTVESKNTFLQFCEEKGDSLAQHALFDALSAHFAAADGVPSSWRHWPETYRTPSSPTVASFSTAHADQVDYYKWLQWLADTQLANAQNTALKQGMEFGLYRDLAVGSESAGSEIWSDPAAFLGGVSIGAPPDEYNPSGQNWGLLPFNPKSLRERQYLAYRRLLSANMRHCRALRIDHAFGLARLYLIPEGKTAADGAYLNFPFDELLAVLKIESHRNQCCVIGEDLGTFPANYKAAAAEAGLLSYKVLYFEREHGSSFKKPDHFEPRALATLSTHDLPTLAGWQRGEDLREKEALGIYPSEHLLHRDRASRARDIPLLEEALKSLGDAGASLQERAQLYLARSPCMLVTVQLEDILGVVAQANIPSTTTERPNWRMKLPRPLESIACDGSLQTLAQHITAERQLPLLDYPRATYRLQFHKDFTFYQAAAIAPYLARLGISHVYASPYLQARPGSMHGYDITDHNRLNSELGGPDGYNVFCQALDDAGLKQILDFVPNHMGVGGSDNAWWLDVLEWGRLSRYANYFDINWEPRYPGDIPKIIVPSLSNHYGDVLRSGELNLSFDEQEGSFSVWHFAHQFPICPRDYAVIEPSLLAPTNYDDGEKLKKYLCEDFSLRPRIQQRVAEMNADKEQLHELLELQHYRLAFWRVAASDINFRRFFDINDLAGMRVEDKTLFDAMHQLVISLFKSGKIAGLRIDHIDGLADPAAYCRALKDQCGSSLYLTVEKILANHESLPDDWPIEGTSGYDALNLISDVFVNPRGQKPMDRVYQRFTNILQSPEDMAYDAKLLVLETTMASELQSLTFLLKQIAGQSRYSRDYPFDTLKQALKDIIGRFPVYRTYITADYVSETDVKTVKWAVGKAKKRSHLVDVSVYDFILSLLLLEREPATPLGISFVRKFQQLSGPVMAKGVEDTTFYRFNRLISLNEVGGSFSRFGLPIKLFHQLNKLRSQTLAHSMLATATHDTKRGEDMRMRLHVLSERPLLWGKQLARWRQFNRSCRSVHEDNTAPTANDEYFIYQTLLGSWPNELMKMPPDPDGLSTYLKRLEDYLVKSMREGKWQSNWSNPNTEYETSVIAFVRQILDPARSNPFLNDLVGLAHYLSVLGMNNGLGQVVLKLTLPGVPDIYQGCEFWDYSLVDPDNRRPVNYAERELLLDSSTETLMEKMQHWQDGQVKQSVIHILLKHRALYPDLYAFGDYEAVSVSGRDGDRVLAFRRSYKSKQIVVVVPLFLATLVKQDVTLPLPAYKDATLDLSRRHIDILTNKTFEGTVALALHACDFPILVLETAA